MQNEEKWKNIPYYSGRYQASTLGRIKNVETGEILKSFSFNDDTHQYVGLHTNGINIQVGVHRLVASTFIPNMKFETVVHHIDNNPENNRVDNLMWVSQRQNLLFQDRFQNKIEKYSITDGGRTLLTFNTKRELATYIGISIKLLNQYLKENEDGTYSITYEDCELVIIHFKELKRAMEFENRSTASKGNENKKGKGKIQQFINNLNEEELNKVKNDIDKLSVRKFKAKWDMTKKSVISAVESLENKEVA